MQDADWEHHTTVAIRPAEESDPEEHQVLPQNRVSRDFPLCSCPSCSPLTFVAFGLTVPFGLLHLACTHVSSAQPTAAPGLQVARTSRSSKPGKFRHRVDSALPPDVCATSL